MTLTLDFRLRSAAPDTLSLRALQMGSGDPAFIVGLCTGSNSRSISTGNSNLVSGIDLLASAGGAFGTLATLATALLLRKQSGNPGVVNKVDGSGEGSEENNIEEDTANTLLATAKNVTASVKFQNMQDAFDGRVHTSVGRKCW